MGKITGIGYLELEKMDIKEFFILYTEAKWQARTK
jgi:hypothetical protein